MGRQLVLWRVVTREQRPLDMCTAFSSHFALCTKKMGDLVCTALESFSMTGCRMSVDSLVAASQSVSLAAVPVTCSCY